MNRVLTALFVLIAIAGHSQSKLEISFDKSVMLVFESTVKTKGWSCGQKELVSIAVQDNKMILQAKEEYFEETNLIVELENGTIYAFDLVYNNAPKMFFHVIKSTQASYVPSKPVVTAQRTEAETISSPKQSKTDKVKPNTSGQSRSESKTGENRTDLETSCDKIIHSPDHIKRIGIITKKMYLYVGGIFVENDKLFFKVNVRNVSTVPYDVDYVQFLIRTVKSGLGRNVSPQADKILPMYVREPDSMTITQNETKTWVFVFEKFTIADDKKLFMEYFEKNGERVLEINIDPIDILNAKNNL